MESDSLLYLHRYVFFSQCILNTLIYPWQIKALAHQGVMPCWDGDPGVHPPWVSWPRNPGHALTHQHLTRASKGEPPHTGAFPGGSPLGRLPPTGSGDELVALLRQPAPFVLPSTESPGRAAAGLVGSGKLSGVYSHASSSLGRNNSLPGRLPHNLREFMGFLLTLSSHRAGSASNPCCSHCGQ